MEKPILKKPPTRERLPDERKGLVHRFCVGDVKIYVKTGQYPDGRLGEVFLKASKQGSLLSGMADAFSIVLSVALQYGVPLKVITEKLKNTRFEPQGEVKGAVIEPPRCNSILDYLARWLEARYIKPNDS